MTNGMKGQVMQTIATLMTTAFGLIAALAWNETIKAIIAIAGGKYLFSSALRTKAESLLSDTNLSPIISVVQNMFCHAWLFA